MSPSTSSPDYAQRKADYDALERAMVSDSLFAMGVTFVGASALSLLGLRFSPWYRGTPISAKTAFILAPTLGAFYIRGEHVSTEFRRSKYLAQLDPDERAAILNQRARIDARRSMADRSIAFVTDHRWSILGYTWLLGISGSILYLYKKRGMTVTQKAVQARMYAQAITIIGILSTAAIASLSDKTNDKHLHHNSAALEAALAADTKVERAQ
ncbi:Replication factor C, subunit RFC4 [Coemansia thaxteri]|uniref:Replication factor C, subunit RFC4 n=1 Tax=Coemansia thaxteri TaxID=2663907 RepID=A0A9W8BC06_9FUNG|nr:Replication factor C, subunit RFC4 [Coemansia thaxteri]KAJ2003627.1 Replication factor C, subunit RFC4 [Coemansia thaxteri]KAJ2467394.1 Replication factor C, subunit RFC4 [Coemansia sp. RSA 2320]